jgi:DNA-nicking Smr family endonuclease
MFFKEFFKKLWQSSAPNIIPTLDLHGLSVKDAIAETKAFLEMSQRAEIPEVRVVYGKGLGSPGGQGVLRQVIPAWCEKEGNVYVESFQREVDSRGGDGSVLILVKKHPPQKEVTDRPE